MSNQPVIHSRYNVPVSKGLDCSVDTPLTQQHFKAECDINRLIARYEKTGFFYDPLRTPVGAQPIFGDFISVPEFQAAQQVMANATQLFESLPAHIRKRFGNDPAQLLAFMDDPKNRKEAELLGFVEPKKDGVVSSGGVSHSEPGTVPGESEKSK